jgi:hypothetical protein
MSWKQQDKLMTNDAVNGVSFACSCPRMAVGVELTQKGLLLQACWQRQNLNTPYFIGSCYASTISF